MAWPVKVPAWSSWPGTNCAVERRWTGFEHDIHGHESSWSSPKRIASGLRKDETTPAAIRATPDDPQQHVLLGLALAYLGRKEEAIREGQRGAALVPVAKDAYLGAYVQHQLVRIFMLVGEPEKALDRLEPLLRIPYYVSPGWLKIDPNFDPLRGNPRFQKFIAEK